MPLPINFNGWSHTLSVIRFLHNQQVKNRYKDVENIDDLGNKRASQKIACIIDAHDTPQECVAKMFLYWIVLGNIRTIIEPYYGIPANEVNANVKGQPQIVLVFKEPRLDAMKQARQPLSTGIRFRLMDETEETLTMAKLEKLAEAIKRELGGATPHKIHRGKDLMTYKHLELGYNYQLYVYNENEARELIRKVHGIRNHTPDWKNYFQPHPVLDKSKYPEDPPRKRILGESYKPPTKRPEGIVEFKYAYCRFASKKNPTYLYDRTGTFHWALETEYRYLTA